jgi:general secretion pathway protein G
LLKWALLLATVMLLPACSNRSEEAQEIFKSHMSEKVYLEFQNLETFPGGAVCGEYRSNDPMRGSSRYRRFVVWGESAKEKPTQQDWDIFCSEDAAAAVRTHFGIGPVAEEENHLLQIRDDLRQLQNALEQYREDNFFLPSPEQGLTALTSAATTPPVPTKFRPGGYLNSLRLDPWGRPYIYENAGLGGGVAQQFQLSTLGADGVRGGEGKNADVALKHLKYLDHLNPT